MVQNLTTEILFEPFNAKGSQYFAYLVCNTTYRKLNILFCVVVVRSDSRHILVCEWIAKQVRIVHDELRTEAM